MTVIIMHKSSKTMKTMPVIQGRLWILTVFLQLLLISVFSETVRAQSCSAPTKIWQIDNTVEAKRVWQGTFGFLDQCYQSPTNDTQGSPPQTKYLKCNYEGTYNVNVTPKMATCKLKTVSWRGDVGYAVVSPASGINSGTTLFLNKGSNPWMVIEQATVKVTSVDKSHDPSIDSSNNGNPYWILSLEIDDAGLFYMGMFDLPHNQNPGTLNTSADGSGYPVNIYFLLEFVDIRDYPPGHAPTMDGNVSYTMSGPNKVDHYGNLNCGVISYGMPDTTPNRNPLENIAQNDPNCGNSGIWGIPNRDGGDGINSATDNSSGNSSDPETDAMNAVAYIFGDTNQPEPIETRIIG